MRQQVARGAQGGHGLHVGVQIEGPVGDGEHAVDLVGDEHHRGPEVVAQLKHEFIEVRAVERVQAGAGFVQEQHGRVERQGPGQRRALAHAARQRRGHQVEGVVQAHQGQLEARTAFALGTVQWGEQAHGQHQVLAQGQPAPQGTGLEHHAKATAQRVERGFVAIVQIVALEAHGALHRFLQADQVAQQGALAAAAGAQDHQHLVAVHVEVQVALDHLAAHGQP